MSQWYLSYDGKQTGPMNQSQAAVQAPTSPMHHQDRRPLPDDRDLYRPFGGLDHLADGIQRGQLFPPVLAVEAVSSSGACNCSKEEDDLPESHG